jgi:hypothetical protein
MVKISITPSLDRFASDVKNFIRKFLQQKDQYREAPFVDNYSRVEQDINFVTN